MRPLFVNYVKHRTRSSPVNIAAARAVLGLYLIWKILSNNWSAIQYWPVRLVEAYTFVAPPPIERFLAVEAWVAVAFLCLFVVGYRLGPVSFLSALLVVHLGAVRFTIRTSGDTDAFFIGAYFVLAFGLFRGADALSLDGFRRTRTETIDALNDRLQSTETHEYRTSALAVGLLAVAIIYFGSAFDKIRTGSLLEWATAENLTQFILYAQEWFGIRTATAAWIAEFAIAHPLLIELLAWGTIALEAGLLIAAVARLPITPVVLGLFGMHAAIAVAMGPFFFDQFVFLALFFAWDTLYARLVREETIDLVYDERCYFCARSLYPFKLLNINNTVNFHTQSTAPERYRERDGVEFEDAMYVFANGETHEGYYAFQRLIRQFRVFVPVVWLMGLSPVARVGERVYGHIAANRSRYFTCAVDTDTQG